MDERGANIDLLFRNGLKDYEVLPPPEVWDNIHPVVKKKSRSVIVFRAAALIAVIVTLSFVAVRLSNKFSTGSENTVASFDIQSNAPELAPSVIHYPPAGIIENSPVNLSSLSYAETIPENIIRSEIETDFTAQITETDQIMILSPGRISFQTEPPVSRLVSPYKKPFEFKIINPLFVPDLIPVKNPQKWSIAAMASPTYYSRFGSDNDAARQLMASEQAALSYSGGLAVSYKLNKRFSVQTGLYYASLGQQVDGINSFGGFQKYENSKGDHNFEVLTTSGTVYTNNLDVFVISDGTGGRVQTQYTADVFDPKKASLQYIDNTMIQNFSYLELPVVVRYKFIDKTIDFNLIGGLSYGLLVNNSAYLKSGGSKVPFGYTRGVNPLTLSSSLGMGMEYNISNKFSLNFEPTFRYYLNPFNEVTGSKNHPYSFGVFSGLSYKF